MLGAREHIPRNVESRGWGIGGRVQILVMPAGAVSPQVLNVAVLIGIEHLLGAIRLGEVGGDAAKRSRRSAAQRSQILYLPYPWRHGGCRRGCGGTRGCARGGLVRRAT